MSDQDTPDQKQEEPLTPSIVNSQKTEIVPLLKEGEYIDWSRFLGGISNFLDMLFSSVMHRTNFTPGESPGWRLGHADSSYRVKKMAWDMYGPNSKHHRQKVMERQAARRAEKQESGPSETTRSPDVSEPQNRERNPKPPPRRPSPPAMPGETRYAAGDGEQPQAPEMGLAFNAAHDAWPEDESVSLSTEDAFTLTKAEMTAPRRVEDPVGADLEATRTASWDMMNT